MSFCGIGRRHEPLHIKLVSVSGGTPPLKSITYTKEFWGNSFLTRYIIFMLSIAHQELALGKPEFCVYLMELAMT